MWALGTFLSRETLMRQFEAIVSYALPRDPHSKGNIADLLVERARAFTMHRKLFGTLGLIGFFWTAMALMGTIRKTIFQVLGLEVKKSFIRRTLYDLRMLLIAGFFFTSSTLVTTFFGVIREAAMNLPPGQVRFTVIRVAIPVLSALGLTILLYFSIYRFLSSGKLKFYPALFGAFWAAVMYELAKDLFAIYLSRIGNLGAVYGTLEVVIGLLLWIFYSTCVFIFGAELSLAYATVGPHARSPGAAAGPGVKP